MFDIEEEIAKSGTMPGDFYTCAKTFESLKDHLFSSAWLYVSDVADTPVTGTVKPVNLIPGFLDEPLLVTRDTNNKPHCLSNVCTHRANILVQGATQCREIACNYHGRRFGLDGKFKFMPGFEGVENFPSACDDLPELELQEFAGLQFTSLNPKVAFLDVFGEMQERMHFMPFDQLKFDESRSQDYLVKANWALYCDNYLEGFHIPFVHPGLNAALDFSEYKYELFKYANLQIGIGKSDDHIFDIPSGHPDEGELIAAYYWWVYPNMMFNFYPWGLSFNVVNPIKPDLTKVSFRTYIWDESKLDLGAGSDLEKVEREDEMVVEQVQKGVRSRLYQQGRYSAKMEKGVHQFHRLLASSLQNT